MVLFWQVHMAHSDGMVLVNQGLHVLFPLNMLKHLVEFARAFALFLTYATSES